ncbi:protein EI24 homolog isoform X2 [Amborella trichopoda]|uniref:protein EI24 homolog isoform X2 n=1 Tax=Amborella trichopoda TaxID=13333 RepID=UPI0009BE30E4|nr:protein EI24 homolog isoform X2 [Amborella trichopoda]|eukprot:XP_020530647.1 protein EI24 homolog isoform X2 [Amborella trichopoda]
MDKVSGPAQQGGVMEWVRVHSKQAAMLWLAGFKEACCFHRLLFFFRRSRTLVAKTGKCFALNGLIFLGSIWLVRSLITPMLLWILPDQWQHDDFGAGKDIYKYYSFMRSVLISLFYVFWFYPLYISSYIISIGWYNDIAQSAFHVIGGVGHKTAQPSGQNDLSNAVNHVGRPDGFEGIVYGFGEQVYSFLMLNIFYIEVTALGFIPYAGKLMNFLLLSWMYAYYCFEYKWSLSVQGLDKRLNFFETNWAFFAGFGSPCAVVTFLFSQLVGYAIMATLFPFYGVSVYACCYCQSC